MCRVVILGKEVLSPSEIEDLFFALGETPGPVLGFENLGSTAGLDCEHDIIFAPLGREALLDSFKSSGFRTGRIGFRSGGGLRREICLVECDGLTLYHPQGKVFSRPRKAAFALTDES